MGSMCLYMEAAPQREPWRCNCSKRKLDLQSLIFWLSVFLSCPINPTQPAFPFFPLPLETPLKKTSSLSQVRLHPNLDLFPQVLPPLPPLRRRPDLRLHLPDPRRQHSHPHLQHPLLRPRPHHQPGIHHRMLHVHRPCRRPLRMPRATIKPRSFH